MTIAVWLFELIKRVFKWGSDKVVEGWLWIVNWCRERLETVLEPWGIDLAEVIPPYLSSWISDILWLVPLTNGVALIATAYTIAATILALKYFVPLISRLVGAAIS